MSVFVFAGDTLTYTVPDNNSADTVIKLAFENIVAYSVTAASEPLCVTITSVE